MYAQVQAFRDLGVNSISLSVPSQCEIYDALLLDRVASNRVLRGVMPLY